MWKPNELQDVTADLTETKSWPKGAYLCENFTCQLPTSDPKVLAAQLEAAANNHVLTEVTSA